MSDDEPRPIPEAFIHILEFGDMFPREDKPPLPNLGPIWRAARKRREAAMNEARREDAPPIARQASKTSRAPDTDRTEFGELIESIVDAIRADDSFEFDPERLGLTARIADLDLEPLAMPEQIIAAHHAGDLTEADMMARLLDHPYTFGRFDPTSGDGYVTVKCGGHGVSLWAVSAAGANPSR